MGILPLQFVEDQTPEKLGLSGKEEYSITISDDFKIGDFINVKTNTGVEFKVKVRLDTAPEVEYYKNNGILLYVLRKILGSA
jgi:aconitate hydratase